MKSWQKSQGIKRIAIVGLLKIAGFEQDNDTLRHNETIYNLPQTVCVTTSKDRYAKTLFHWSDNDNHLEINQQARANSVHVMMCVL